MDGLKCWKIMVDHRLPCIKPPIFCPMLKEIGSSGKCVGHARFALELDNKY